MSFLNKVVLITGAGSGIGKAIALNFAKLSAKLSLVDLNSESLANVKQECETVGGEVLKVETNLVDDKNVKETVRLTIEKYGRIDVVVNCAGISAHNGVTSPHLLDNLTRVLNINLVSHIVVTHFAADALIESKGCVVNISSIFGTSAIKTGLAYAVSKAGMVHFTKCAALELAEKGVRVNSISPGPVKTNLMNNHLNNQEEIDKFFKRFEESSPLKHIAKAEEIAEMAVFLASDKAKSITGTDVIIDSGMSLKTLL